MKRLKPRLPASGFTLLEVIVVMTIMILIIGIGYASFSFLEDDDPLEKPIQQLTQMSKHALNTAVLNHRGMIIGFNKDSFGIIGSEAEGMGSFSLSEDIKVSLRRWGDRDWAKAEGQIWYFGEQGICEPLKVRFEDKQGNSREVSFHPLTGGLVN
jgi:prepilin-type N-terminal cleavage/methylation domain-containing protein